MEDEFGKVRFVEASYVPDYDGGDVDDAEAKRIENSARRRVIVDLKKKPKIDYGVVKKMDLG